MTEYISGAKRMEPSSDSDCTSTQWMTGYIHGFKSMDHLLTQTVLAHSGWQNTSMHSSKEVEPPCFKCTQGWIQLSTKSGVENTPMKNCENLIILQNGPFGPKF